MPVTHKFDEFALRPSRFAKPAPMSAADALGSRMPLQDLGADLVQELARVGWDVPSLGVEIRTYGRGSNLVTRVASIVGSTEAGPFELHFRGSQGLSGGYHVPTGLNQLLLPEGWKLAYHEDGSRSAERFRGTEKDWSSPDRSYLDGWHQVNDAGPVFWDRRTAEARRLVGEVLERLRRTPAAEASPVDAQGFDAALRGLIAIEPQPVPEGFPALYVWERRGEMGDAGLPPWRRGEGPENDYVLAGNGKRLVALGDARGPLPRRATDGFTYASTDPNAKAVAPGWHTREDALPVEVKLAALNEVYVVDAEAYDAERRTVEAEAFEAGQKELTGVQISRPYRAVALTMVPAAEYPGGYVNPLVLIGRQLHADEARVMSGPVTVSAEDGRVGATMRDSVSGLELRLFEPEEIRRGSVREARRIAGRVAETLGVRMRECGLPEEANAPAPVF